MADALQPEPERYYPLEQLTDVGKGIRGIVETLPACRTALEQAMAARKPQARELYALLERTRGELSAHLNTSRLALLELDEEKQAAYAALLLSQLGSFNLMTHDYTQLCGVLSAFADSLPQRNTVSAATIGRLMNNVKCGFYPTDPANVDLMLGGISFPEGVTTNLLDPCCGKGDALKRLAVGNNCFTYGVELDGSRAEAAQDQLHRVGYGSYFYAQMSREAFHLVLLNPPYLSVMTQFGGRSRDEKRFLIESIPRLVYGGLLIYIVPYYRLTPDICRILCDNFAELSVHKFTEPEFSQFKQVAVMGLRKRQEDGSAAALLLERSVELQANIPYLTELARGRYALPSVPLSVPLFKGAEFNELELARQLRASDSFDRLFSKSTLDGAGRRPPLPLSIGQIGLVGGSGMINGLMECDYPHVIKGRIVKERRYVEEPFYGANGRLVSTETRVTITNKMIFNVLTPEGFRSLT